MERENAIRRAWCYFCSLAYTSRLEKPSFPAAIADSALCADCWESITYEILSLPTHAARQAYWGLE
jgi:hypothetical protein